MRTGRPKQPLIVTNEERQRLESLTIARAVKPCSLVALGWCWAVLKDWITRRSPRVALLVGHGWQVAVALRGGALGRAIRRTTFRSATQDQR